MTFTVPIEKVENVLSLVKQVLNSNFTTAKQISKIAGHLISMKPAIGSVARLFTRQMYKFVDSRISWYSPQLITKDLKDELEFWLTGLHEHNGFRIQNNPMSSTVIFSDASDFGYGGYTFSRMGELIAKGNFRADEINSSSTNRELLAVKYILSSFSSFVTQETVQWNTDNQNVVSIILNGSPKAHLQRLAVDIFNLSLKYNVEIIPKWIPRSENDIADHFSKLTDNDNWGIDNSTFRFIEQTFGKFSIDQFADELNKKVQRFNAKFYCPGVENVNAFSVNWKYEFNWLCPPISLIAKVIKHMQFCNGQGVLLVPRWESAYYWPILNDGQKFYPFVKGVFVVNPFFVIFEILDNVLFIIFDYRCVVFKLLQLCIFCLHKNKLCHIIIKYENEIETFDAHEIIDNF